jgi:hypothetical protein
LPKNLQGLDLTDFVGRAEADILRYLLAHEAARDTVEGIEKWWLPPSRPYSRADIERALRDLKQRDLVRMWQPASALPIYGHGAADRQALDDFLLKLHW